MTEAEWLACADPAGMLAYLKQRVPPASSRKLILFVLVCWRHKTFGEKVQSIREVQFRYVDGHATYKELSKALYDLYGPGNWDEEVALDAACDCDFAALEAASASDYAEPPSPVLIEQAAFLRDVFGNPFRPVSANPRWLTSSALDLARTMYDSRDFAAMPILADALEEAGCDNVDILAHCRGDGPHVRGCWVVDLILGKN
jgi:hypothetical protein